MFAEESRTRAGDGDKFPGFRVCQMYLIRGKKKDSRVGDDGGMRGSAGGSRRWIANCLELRAIFAYN